MEILRFYLARSTHYNNKSLDYDGDNSNVTTWAEYRRPKNRSGQYPNRILNGFEAERICAIFHCYISPMRNAFCDELARPPGEEIRDHGKAAGYSFDDVSIIFSGHLADRVRSRSLVLPTYLSDRVQRIMKFVGRRIARRIPTSLWQTFRIALLGKGDNFRNPIANRLEQMAFRKPLCLKWPIEASVGGSPSGTDVDDVRYVVCSLPQNSPDVEISADLSKRWPPPALSIGSHPDIETLPLLNSRLLDGWESWNWWVSTAALGGPQSRGRVIHVSVLVVINSMSQMSMANIHEVCLPATIEGHLDAACDASLSMCGEFAVASASFDNLMESLGLGCMRLARDIATRGSSRAGTPKRGWGCNDYWVGWSTFCHD